MTKEDRHEIFGAISEMLDAPDECGIYPTTKCYDRLEGYMESIRGTEHTPTTFLVKVKESRPTFKAGEILEICHECTNFYTTHDSRHICISDTIKVPPPKPGQRILMPDEFGGILPEEYMAWNEGKWWEGEWSGRTQYLKAIYSIPIEKPENPHPQQEERDEQICERCGYPKDVHPITTCWGEEPSDTPPTAHPKEPAPELPKPPIGLKPRQIHDEQRIDEITAAIGRYIEDEQPISVKWIDEYNQLINPQEVK
jgi:hypothetical protein